MALVAYILVAYILETGQSLQHWSSGGNVDVNRRESKISCVKTHFIALNLRFVDRLDKVCIRKTKQKWLRN